MAETTYNNYDNNIIIMTTIKVKFRPSPVADRKGPVYYQIIHDRKIRLLSTEYLLYSSEWNEKRSAVRTSNGNERHNFLHGVREKIHRDIERLTRIARRLDGTNADYSVDDIVDEFNRYLSEYSLFHFMESVIARLKDNGNIRTSETYRSALNSFRKFRSGQNIMLDSISSELMAEYESWLKQRNVTPNTISFYNRILRAVYNRALEHEVFEDRRPFRYVYTGIDKTVKRALPLPALKKIKALDLTAMPSLDFARDKFLMSFCLRGMSFIDMAFLKKRDLKNSYVTYRRRKTGQLLTIAWTPQMQMILDKYPENKSDYLLPIIRNPGTNERCTYRNAGYNINRNLKQIALMVGVTIPLTLYVARHSWASAAKAKGIPISVISEGMGHDSETTTRIYLASLDTSVVDRANSLILKSLN